MAKQVYKIPADLDMSHLDMEISLQSSDGMGLRPIAVKVILFYAASLMFLFFVFQNTFMLGASLGTKVLFAISWILMTHQLGRYTKRQTMQYDMVPSFMRYFPKVNRKIICRRSSLANGFYYLYGIKGIDEKTGEITFIDGTFGFMYRVVGSASRLLFEEDRDAIINRCDNFYRKIGTDAQIITITTKEAQKVYQQVAHLNEQYNNLTIADEDLYHLLDEQYQILSKFIGGGFRSIHQYWILKADNKEALLMARGVLLSEVESSNEMIKRCTRLDSDEIEEVMTSIYRANERGD